AGNALLHAGLAFADQHELRVVGRARHAGVADPRHVAVVDEPVAVVVEAVAHLGAAAAADALEEPVLASVLAAAAPAGLADRRPRRVGQVVDDAVAVVVLAVADLGHAGHHRRVAHRALAVGAADEVPGRVAKTHAALARHAEVGEAVVDDAVAVVVLAVA